VWFSRGDLRQVDLVDVDPGGVAAPAYVHQFGVERHQVLDGGDGLRRGIRMEFRRQYVPVDDQFEVTHGRHLPRGWSR
jgi:hypothetical protein